MEESTDESFKHVMESKSSSVTSERKEQEAIEIVTKTTTRTETTGLAIVGARLLSETGKLENVVLLPPPVAHPISTTPSHTSSLSTFHLSSTPSSNQNIVVRSESSHMETSSFSTQPATLISDQPSLTKEETGVKKCVRFEETTEILPEREMSSESEAQDISSDTQSQQLVDEAASVGNEEEIVSASEPEPTTEEATTEQISEPEADPVVEVEAQPMKEEEAEQQPLQLEESENKDKIEFQPETIILETAKESSTVEQEPDTAMEDLTKVEPRVDEPLETEESNEPQKRDEPEHNLGPPDSETLQEDVTSRETTEEHQQTLISSVEENKHGTKEERAHIQEGNLKNQLQEIIDEIDQDINAEESQPRPHTWQPKGVYKVEKTEIKFEDVVPIKVDDVKVEEPSKSEVPKENDPTHKFPTIDADFGDDSHQLDEHSQHLKVLRHILMNGEVLSPTEIPIGIPLLAKILPHENEEDREKIPLERLFTPASDWEEIIPHKKKAYASSCFYRPDHPTIDDQVELAHKISVSLVDETNKTSKGQSMYIKRKNRSAKWIHQGAKGELAIPAAEQYDMDDENEEEPPQTKERVAPLKLVMSSKGAQDYSQVQHHYEELLTTSQTLKQISNMEVGMEIASDLQSPTGKGAALFAKRKKRMDKFIIDETTVPQQQQHQSVVCEASETSSLATAKTTVNSYQTSSTYEAKISSLSQKQTGSITKLQNEPVVASPSAPRKEPNPAGGLALPDLAEILTKPKPPEKKTPSLASRGITTKKTGTPRSHSADSGFQNKRIVQGQQVHAKETGSNQRVHKEPAGKLFNASSNAGHQIDSSNHITNGICSQDPLANLRPGSPPTFMIPNGLESFIEHKVDSKPFQSIDTSAASSETTVNNECGAIYTAEVKYVQQSSPLPSSSVINFQAPAPQHSILSDLSSTHEKDKRKSFNLAPKGWGTYNTYYTPVHLGAP